LKSTLTRRDVLSSAAMGLAALAARPSWGLSAKARHLPIGYTSITWKNTEVQSAVETVAKLGFYGFETFGDNLIQWESKGGLKPLLQQNKLPLISGYCTMVLTEPAKLKDELDKAAKYCDVILKSGGRIYVLGPNQVKRQTYVYADNKVNVVNALNEIAKVVADHGLTPVLHQHTGTCVESRDETYATLDAVNTHLLKFGPDVGQLKKGGQDPVQVVKDYLPLVQHMHLKDFSGTDDHLLGYCPLGKGKVDVPAILDLMAGRKISGMVMTELDNDWHDPSPTPAPQLAQDSRDYLSSLGVRFRK
jgi:inosose dehydratase